MKKTITTFAIILTLLTVEVQASQLIIQTRTFNAKAVISGDVFFSQDGQFHITQLRPGRHFVTISEKRGRRNNQNYRRGNGNHRGGHHVLFHGKIFIPEGSKVFATVTPQGRLIIDDMISIRRGQRYKRPQGCKVPPTRSGQVRDYDKNAGRDYSTDRDNRGGRNNNSGGYSRGTNSTFNVVLGQIQRALFESNKKTIASQYIMSNDITSNEVLQLINQFDFESSKLDFAKQAYTRTMDPENYYVVNEGFGFSSSINALDRHIRNQ